jgi:hypothetical protein
MAAMDFNDERDDLADDGGVVAHRDRAKRMLDQIAAQARQALSEQSIDTPLFFIVPNTGDAVLIFGSPDDLDDKSWDRLGGIVASVVAGLVGLSGTRRREMRCATTYDQESKDAAT